jgi:PAS domain S-box-containing protein
MPDNRVLRGEKIKDELLLIDSNNKQFYASVSAAPIFDEVGNVLMGVISCRDVTERLNYEKTLK